MQGAVIESSFLKAFFQGQVPDELLFPYPVLATEERERLRGLVERCRGALAGLDPAQIDERGEPPAGLVEALGRAGVLGLEIDPRHGGLGLSCMAQARVLEEIGGIDQGVAFSVAAHQVAVQAIVTHGVEAQRARFLPSLAAGGLAAFALTEAGSGSDAASLQTRAELRPDGQFSLSGEKIWVTNAAQARVSIVFARTVIADEGSKPRITAFLVEPGPGVSVEPSPPAMGLRGAQVGRLSLDGAIVSPDRVLGEPGKGFRVAMEAVSLGRIGLAATSLGAARALTREAIERVRRRKAFNRVIGELGLIKDKIATMVASLWAVESCLYLCAGLVDAGVGDHSMESAACKIIASETLALVADEALRIAGASGLARGAAPGRLLRDSRAGLFFGGTSETLRCFIALSGMQSPGRLDEVGRAMREPIKGFGLLSELAMRTARSVLGRDRHRAHPMLAREAALLGEYSGELARYSERIVRRHGKDVAEKQFAQRRIADLALLLFSVAACVSRATRAIEEKGEEGARRELDLTGIHVSGAERKMGEIVRSFERNDDDLRKAVASRAYADGAYPFDIL
jgi:acyl-CoA dehydrogenase family protein 9